MNVFVVLHVGIALATIILGILVFVTNTKRVTNLVFLIMSGIIVAWLIGLGISFYIPDENIAELAVRITHVLGAFIPLSFNAIRLSIIHHNESRLYMLRNSYLWIILAAAVGVLCFTDVFLKGITFAGSAGSGIPEPEFGRGILIYGMHQFCVLGIFVWKLPLFVTRLY